MPVQEAIIEQDPRQALSSHVASVHDTCNALGEEASELLSLVEIQSRVLKALMDDLVSYLHDRKDGLCSRLCGSDRDALCERMEEAHEDTMAALVELDEGRDRLEALIRQFRGTTNISFAKVSSLDGVDSADIGVGQAPLRAVYSCSHQ